MKRLLLILCCVLLAVVSRAQIIINGDDGTLTIDGVVHSLYEESEPLSDDPPVDVPEDVAVPDVVRLSSGWVINKEQCTISKDGKSFKLQGRVRIVDSFEDIRVRVIDYGNEDLRVLLTDSSYGDCCRFRIVDGHSEDIRVRIVDSFEDITIRIVSAGEGVVR